MKLAPGDADAGHEANPKGNAAARQSQKASDEIEALDSTRRAIERIVAGG